MMFDMEMVVTLIALMLAGVALVIVKPWLEAKVGAETLKTAWKHVCIAVTAAEQIFGSGNGVRKKEFALATLEELGVTAKVGIEQTDRMIEAAVYDLT